MCLMTTSGSMYSCVSVSSHPFTKRRLPRMIAAARLRTLQRRQQLDADSNADIATQGNDVTAATPHGQFASVYSSSWSHRLREPSRRCTTMSTVDRTPPEVASRTGGIVS